ncbi:MAG: hypothetical protein ACE5KT_08050 [Methanosarcinales archaeon]
MKQYERVGKIKEVKLVPRVGKIISLELLSKRRRWGHGSESKA